jgi:hypothetical protein
MIRVVTFLPLSVKSVLDFPLFGSFDRLRKAALAGAAVSKYAAIQVKRWTGRFFLNWAITC